MALTCFALLLAFNQVVIKVTNGGLQPIFFAGLRSAGAVICIYLWMRWRGIPLQFLKGTILVGIITGMVFAFEFMFLFIALDLTTVGRSGVIFYSMPLWLTILAHIFVDGDKLTAQKIAGLGFALAGVAWAILARDSGEANVWGDLAALGAAIGWAVTALLAKASPLSRVRPEMQLMWQVGVSAPILLIASLFYGDFIRDLAPIHLWGLAFQIVIVVSAGFIFWLYLLALALVDLSRQRRCLVQLLVAGAECWPRLAVARRRRRDQPYWRPHLGRHWDFVDQPTDKSKSLSVIGRSRCAGPLRYQTRPLRRTLPIAHCRRHALAKPARPPAQARPQLHEAPRSRCRDCAQRGE